MCIRDRMETLTFPEAVRAVAGKMGIPLPAREFHSPQEARAAGLRKQLLDIHEAATQFFEQNLKSPEAARAREYLSGRGVTAETIAKFRIGYAPESFNEMRERLGKQFREEVLRASGLFLSLIHIYWSALCPFHKEKSGSFYLYPGTASYYCFGCHEHGDVFTLSLIHICSEMR